MNGLALLSAALLSSRLSVGSFNVGIRSMLRTWLLFFNEVMSFVDLLEWPLDSEAFELLRY